MGDLKDKFEVGDRVTYGFDGQIRKTIIIQDGDFLDSRCNILKIERPTYDTIFEAEVEFEENKPELLTEEERKTLLDIIGNFNGYSCEKVYTICIERNRNATVTVNVGSRKLSNIGNIMVSNLSFDKLESNLAYTLEELGLENG